MYHTIGATYHIIAMADFHDKFFVFPYSFRLSFRSGTKAMVGSLAERVLWRGPFQRHTWKNFIIMVQIS